MRFVMFCFRSESGSCDLQAWLSCSWSHETKHALHELSAGRVSGQILHGFYHLMSFQLCFNCLTACLHVFQHHRHVWGIHSESALLSDDLRSKLSLLQSPDWAWNRFWLLLFSGVCGFDKTIKSVHRSDYWEWSFINVWLTQVWRQH